jgi:hypothetical protein
MKSINCKYLLTIVLLLFVQNVWASGGDYSYSQITYLLSKYTIYDKQFNFQFTNDQRYYGYDVNVDETMLNCRQWQNTLQTKNTVTDSAIYQFVYHNNLESITAQQWDNAVVKKAITTNNLWPYFKMVYTYLDYQKDKQWQDEYNDTSNADAIRKNNIKQLYTQAEKLLQTNTNKALSWRYFYLLLRLPFFNNDPAIAKQYYEKYIGQMSAADGFVSVWCTGIYSGLLNQLGNTAQAKYYSAVAFANSKDKYHACLTSYSKIPATYQSALAFCTTKKDSLAVYLCEGYVQSQYNTQLLNELNQLDPNDDAFALIWLREVQKIVSIEFSNYNYKTLQDVTKPNNAGMLHAQKLLQIAKAYCSKKGKHTSMIAATLAYYANELGLKNTRDEYLKIAQQNATTSYDKLQAEVVQLVANAKDNPAMDVQEKVHALNFKIDALSNNNFQNINTKQYLLQHILVPNLLSKKDTANAILALLICRELQNSLYAVTVPLYNTDWQKPSREPFWDNPNAVFTGDEFDIYIDLCSVNTLEQCKKYARQKTKLGLQLSKEYNVDYFNYFIAAKYMRVQDWKSALQLYESMPLAMQNYKTAHPYTFAPRDIIYYDDIPNPVNTIDVIKKALQLQTTIKANKATAKDYLDYGTLLYNTSAYGANHFLMGNHFRYQDQLYSTANKNFTANIYFTKATVPYSNYSYTPIQIPASYKNYFRVKHAIPFLQKAAIGLVKPADKAKAYFMLAKIWQNNLDSEIINPSTYVTEEEERKIMKNYLRLSINNPYFKNIKDLGINDTYNQLYSGCNNFRYFIAGR